jgi:hypothetical protein
MLLHGKREDPDDDAINGQCGGSPMRRRHQ